MLAARLAFSGAAIVLAAIVGAGMHLADDAAADHRVATCRQAFSIEAKALTEEQIAFAAASGGYRSEGADVNLTAKSYEDAAKGLERRCR